MKTILAAALAIGTLVCAGAPAFARNDNFCLQGREWGYPGNCAFSTYRQCMASASGTNAACGRNPMSYPRGYQR
ncbi:MAG: DUF3551 domain-containing protein [Proteobacteria bacterium]|nr:DUF3551 domain-containing protein [Pseudomonadota bacterium]